MLMNRLNQVLNETDLTDSGHAIARSLKHAMKYRQNITISSIAQSAGVSKAMVTKFSRTLGYDGFSGLKKAYEAYLRSEAEKENENMTAADFIREFRCMAEQFDADSFAGKCRGLVKDLAVCRCLYLYGTSSDRICCLMLQDRLFQAGIPAVVLDDQMKKNYAVKEHSVLLVIGHPSFRVLQFGRLFKRRYVLGGPQKLQGYESICIEEGTREMRDCVLFLSVRLLALLVCQFHRRIL